MGDHTIIKHVLPVPQRPLGIQLDFSKYRWAMSSMIGRSSPGRGWEFFSSPPRQDRLWGPTHPPI